MPFRGWTGSLKRNGSCFGIGKLSQMSCVTVNKHVFDSSTSLSANRLLLSCHQIFEMPRATFLEINKRTVVVNMPWYIHHSIHPSTHQAYFSQEGF